MMISFSLKEAHLAVPSMGFLLNYINKNTVGKIVIFVSKPRLASSLVKK